LEEEGEVFGIYAKEAFDVSLFLEAFFNPSFFFILIQMTSEMKGRSIFSQSHP
jgi:hypothetical protein